MAAVMVFALYLVVFLLDFLPVLRAKEKKVLVPYLIIFGAATLIQTLYLLDVQVPSPAKYITQAFDALFQAR